MRIWKAIALCVVAACHSGGDVQEPAPSTTDVAAVYQACWQQFNAQSWDAFGACYADDVVARTEGMPERRGRDAAVAEARSFLSSFPDGTGELQLTLASGNHVFSIVLFRGTHDGPLPGPDGNAIPATHRKVGFLMVHGVEVDASGRAVKEWSVWDPLVLFAQLGLAPGGIPVMTHGWGDAQTVRATGAPVEAANVAAYRDAYAKFSAHDRAMFDLFAPDMIEVHVSDPNSLPRDELIRFNETLWAAFSDIRVELVDAFAAGDYVVGIGRVSGTNDGDFPALGLSKTGRTMDVGFIEITEWKDGKVVRSIPFLNTFQQAMQLGLAG